MLKCAIITKGHIDGPPESPDMAFTHKRCLEINGGGYYRIKVSRRLVHDFQSVKQMLCVRVSATITHCSPLPCHLKYQRNK